MLKILIGAVAVLTLILSGLSVFTWNLQANYVTEKNNNVALTAAKADLEEKVEKANEVSKDFQTKLNGIDRQLRAVRLRYKSSDCVQVDRTERGPNGGGAGEVVLDGNARGGLSPDWLLDFAARCEKTRQKTIGLQKFHKVN